MAAGDIDRALVEFRNVFKLNGQHKEARRLYAEAEVSRGNMREAYAQYLRLAEQYPTDLDANRSLAEIAATSGDLSETERFVTAALAIDPNDPESRAVKIVLDYGQAKEDGDDAGMTAASDAAKALLATLPTNRLLSGVVIDEALLRNDYDAALAGIDAALAATPDDRALFGLRLSTLAAKGDNAGVEAGLISMVRQFPDDPGVADALVRWYVSLKEFDKAEAFLRGNIPA
ncbi:MAG: hypothetical protein RLZZ528_1521, partial [Pseudomonadota bacterium]